MSSVGDVCVDIDCACGVSGLSFSCFGVLNDLSSLSICSSTIGGVRVSGDGFSGVRRGDGEFGFGFGVVDLDVGGE